MLNTLGIAAPLALAAGSAAEQKALPTYSTKPIRLIVQFPEWSTPGLVSRRPARGEGVQSAGFQKVALTALPTYPTKAQIAAQGIEPVGNTPEEFGRIVRAEIEKWARVLKSARTKIN